MSFNEGRFHYFSSVADIADVAKFVFTLQQARSVCRLLSQDKQCSEPQIFMT